ncbi:MAG: biosynthetic peptidoglycan transglycosylase, partial [Thermoanaerobaculia bacterium]
MNLGRRASSPAAVGRPARRRLITAVSAVAIFIAMAAALWVRVGPLPPDLLDRSRFAQTTVVDRNGMVLFESLPASGARSEWLHASALPKPVVDATLAAEDRRFFSHHGVDPIAIARAAVQNVKAMQVVEGGSTITQQVAKLLLDSKDRWLRSKIREAVVAIRLEHRMPKREILALYLNLAPYGNRIQGIARASRAYFGCDPSALTPAQAAYLSALPQRPGAFNPLRDPAAARKRQRAILARMHDAGWLPNADLEHARAEGLHFEKAAHPALAMHF